MGAGTYAYRSLNYIDARLVCRLKSKIWKLVSKRVNWILYDPTRDISLIVKNGSSWSTWMIFKGWAWHCRLTRRIPNSMGSRWKINCQNTEIEVKTIIWWKTLFTRSTITMWLLADKMILGWQKRQLKIQKNRQKFQSLNGWKLKSYYRISLTSCWLNPSTKNSLAWMICW